MTAELGAAAALLRVAAPLPPMMVTYAPRDRWRLMVSPEESVTAARQHVAVKRLAARMHTDIVRRPGVPVWARTTWHGSDLFVSAQRVAGEHAGHGATEEHADLVEALAAWVCDMVEAGAEEVWVHQPLNQVVNPDHRLRVSVHADAELAARLAALDDAVTQRPEAGPWAGSALTPTGHDVVFVRT